jgi:hypothetical protein
MRYALLMCTDESAAIGVQERARRAAALAAFTDQMAARGTLLASEQLRGTETATTVRCWDGGDVMITDGPFAETKEQLGGFWIVQAADLDAALDWAAKAAVACRLPVEVRPFQEG